MNEELILTPHQNTALDEICHWLDEFDFKKKAYYILTGYAGTGKSVLINELVTNLSLFKKINDDNKEKDLEVAVATLTWKAANVLRSKGISVAQSIHSLIYIADRDPVSGELVFTKKTKFDMQSKYSMIIIDEASMVDSEMRKDLASFELPILYVGDNFQLPPVSNNIEDQEFLLSPDSRLTEILRQAEANPIIKMSMLIRDGRTKFNNGTVVDNKVFVFSKRDARDKWLTTADQIIVGYNKTRTQINNHIRQLLGYDPNVYPHMGEKLIALNNIRELKLFNGQPFTSGSDYSTFKLKPNEIKALKIIDEEDKASTVRTIFNDMKTEGFKIPYSSSKDKKKEHLLQIAFAYTITCHKSQGSQWNRVIVYNEAFGRDEIEKARWLYTSCTRAVDKLILLQ
jgi:ATP-dependent exoDNAse (exonuclease V) alpha subunit